jgi:hypothetical protein
MRAAVRSHARIGQRVATPMWSPAAGQPALWGSTTPPASAPSARPIHRAIDTAFNKLARLNGSFFSQGSLPPNPTTPRWLWACGWHGYLHPMLERCDGEPRLTAETQASNGVVNPGVRTAGWCEACADSSASQSGELHHGSWGHPAGRVRKPADPVDSPRGPADPVDSPREGRATRNTSH